MRNKQPYNLSAAYQSLIDKLDPKNNKSIYDLLDDIHILQANTEKNELLQYAMKRLSNQLKQIIY